MAVEAFQRINPFYSPHPKPPVPACWVVGRVLLKFLLISTPKATVILVIFRGKQRKNDAELFCTITSEGRIDPGSVD